MEYVELTLEDLEQEIVAGIIVQNSKCIQPNCKNEGKKRTFYCIRQEHPFLFPNKDEIKKMKNAVKNMELRVKK